MTTPDSFSSLVDVIVRTFNSDRTLDRCMMSIQKYVPVSRIIIIDHGSTDSTIEIAKKYTDVIISENSGLGYATMQGIVLSHTDRILFVDSDVEILRRDFIAEAVRKLSAPSTGAVVGASLGHSFLYGLPLGLTLFRKASLDSLDIPPDINGYETYFIREEMRKRKLKVRYVESSMVHRSTYRAYRYWPEWQGSQARAACGLNLREFFYSMLVIFLMLSNSKSFKNILYFPVFLSKFIIGYTNPGKWKHLDRRDVII